MILSTLQGEGSKGLDNFLFCKPALYCGFIQHNDSTRFTDRNNLPDTLERQAAWRSEDGAIIRLPGTRYVHHHITQRARMQKQRRDHADLARSTR
jgi:hypothetical protein